VTWQHSACLATAPAPLQSRQAGIGDDHHNRSTWHRVALAPRKQWRELPLLLYLALSGSSRKGLILVGHSLGGLTVRVYAQQHPEDVAGLVLVEKRQVKAGISDSPLPGAATAGPPDANNQLAGTPTTAGTFTFAAAGDRLPHSISPQPPSRSPRASGEPGGMARRTAHLAQSRGAENK
jgi:pimeloyl-ACP methyl ester carboxylesterase